MTWREVVYEYDGSFDGLLCCIYESYTQKQLPAAFFRTVYFDPLPDKAIALIVA